MEIKYFVCFVILQHKCKKTYVQNIGALSRPFKGEWCQWLVNQLFFCDEAGALKGLLMGILLPIGCVTITSSKIALR